MSLMQNVLKIFLVLCMGMSSGTAQVIKELSNPEPEVTIAEEVETQEEASEQEEEFVVEEIPAEETPVEESSEENTEESVTSEEPTTLEETTIEEEVVEEPVVEESSEETHNDQEEANEFVPTMTNDEIDAYLMSSEEPFAISFSTPEEFEPSLTVQEGQEPDPRDQRQPQVYPIPSKTKDSKGWIVKVLDDSAADPRYGTRMLVGGTTFVLHHSTGDQDGQHTLYLKGTENTTKEEPAFGEMPNNTTVKLYLGFEVHHPGVEDGDTLIYRLPGALQWDDKPFTFIKNENNPQMPAGWFMVNNNTLYVGYSKEFLEANSKIDTAVYISGRIDKSKFDNADSNTYEFTDLGSLSVDSVKQTNSVVIEKSVATNKTAEDIESYIQYIEDTGKIRLWYNMKVSAYGLNHDIVVTDTVDDPGDNQDPQIVPDSIRVGTDFGLNDKADLITSGPTMNGNREFTLTLSELGSDAAVDEPEFVWITYAMDFNPGGNSYDDYEKPEPNKTKFYLDNTAVVESKEFPTGNQDDTTFDYKYMPVDKSGGASSTDPFTANWTVTYNDYGSLNSLLPATPRIISDSFAKEKYTKEGTDGEGNPTSKTFPGQDLKPKSFVVEKYNGYSYYPLPVVQDETSLDNPVYIDNSDPENPIVFKAEDYFGTGITIPSTLRVRIKYSTYVSDEKLEDAGFSHVEDINKESEKIDIENTGKSQDPENNYNNNDPETVGVGPLPPTVKKTGSNAADSSVAVWTITLTVRDPEITVWDTILYDWISKGNTIRTDVKPKLQVKYTNASGEEVEMEEIELDWTNAEWTDAELLPTGTSTSSYTNAVSLFDKNFIERGDDEAKKPQLKDGNLIPFKPNFIVTLGNIPEIRSIITEGNHLPKGTYTLIYETDLDIEAADPKNVDNYGAFQYTNTVYIYTQGKDVQSAANVKLNLISKAYIDSNTNDLYKRATGDTDIKYQEMTWWTSCVILNHENVMYIHDKFDYNNRSTGTMTLDPDSVVAYEVDSGLSVGSRDVDWSQEKRIEVTPDMIEDKGTEGFSIRFDKGKVSQGEGKKVVLFYKTVGDYDNNVTYYHYNSAQPQFDDKTDYPKDYSYTTRKYDLLKKTADYNEEDDPVVHYVIEINKQRLDLDETDVLKLTDEMGQYLAYHAGSMTFTEIDRNGNEIDRTGQEGYSVDESDIYTLLVEVPDETYVVIKYDATVKLMSGEFGTEADNTVTMKGRKPISSTANIGVAVHEHDAVAHGEIITIRLFKYDLDEPTIALPDAKFEITAYMVEDIDGKHELVPFRSTEANPNPIIESTDENGEITFLGRYDLVYKVREIEAPKGYVATDEVDYFCLPGFHDVERFMDLHDENGDPIDPSFYYIETKVNETRHTFGNRKANTTLNIVKKDSNKKTVLEGAEFNLYKADEEGTEKTLYGGVEGVILVEEGLVSDENGEVVISYLEAGDYYLCETKAPEGYNVEKKDIHFTYDGREDYVFDEVKFIEYTKAETTEEMNELMVINTKIPDTSVKSDRTWIYVGGGAAVALVLLLLTKKRKTGK